MSGKRKQKKSSVSAKEIKEYAEKNNSVRISYHEKVCAERMKTLFKAIDEMRLDINIGWLGWNAFMKVLLLSVLLLVEL